MTKGVVIFAHNNSFNYIKIADFAASQVKKHLGLPVTLITDQQSLLESNIDNFDNLVVTLAESNYNKTFRDGNQTSKSLEWKNLSRVDCFNLSPYDETLVIDADYIINSNKLLYCWNQENDFLIYKNSYDLSTWNRTNEFTYISDYSIPFYWATAFYFRKNKLTEQFFNLVNEIKSNWSYYKLIYQIYSPNFRNDHAFSIAIHMMNGFTGGFFANELPGKMYYTLDLDYLISKDDTQMQFLVEKSKSSGEYIPIKTSNLDVHVMNKYSLLRVIDNE